MKAPFFGYKPYSFAGLVEVTFTNFSGEMRFADNVNANRVSTPAIPFGLFNKSARLISANRHGDSD